MGGGARSGVSGIAKVKTKKQDDTIVEVRVAVTSTCMYPQIKGPIFHYKAYRPIYVGLGRHVLTARAISGPHVHCQVGALHWRHFTNRGFTW